MKFSSFWIEHTRLTRRWFLQMGSTSAALLAVPSLSHADPTDSSLSDAIRKIEPYFTPAADFRDVSRGKPLPHSLPLEKMSEVGLTRETWKLEVVSDVEHPSKIRKPMTKAGKTALDFAGLLKLGETHAVRFPKVMTCLNIGCPLGMGLWEGVPLREIIWKTEPREDLRRVFYYGYHNDDPQQMFRSSLPIGRVLEDPFDLPPVILCYKLNGEWLDSERGGPVRMVVPEAYGFKSIKWLSHVVLSNLSHANDTYASGNNDLDSPLKSFAATLMVPTQPKAGVPIPIAGYAQVGISGVSKVQVWIQSNSTPAEEDDKYFLKAPWVDATILHPPVNWGALPQGQIPAGTLGFEAPTKPEQNEGGLRPKQWPIRFGKLHWAHLAPGLPAGEYTLRCRTVDEKGISQPLPRPFRKSGHAAIEMITLKVTD